MEHNPIKKGGTAVSVGATRSEPPKILWERKPLEKSGVSRSTQAMTARFWLRVQQVRKKQLKCRKHFFQKQKMPTQSTILQCRTDTVYGANRTLQPSEVREQDEQKVWCYTVEPEYTEPFIAGIATSEEIREQMEEYLQQHFGRDGKIKMVEMKLDYMPILEHVAEQEQESSHSIKEIDEKMQQLFPLLANGDTYLQETSCYGHQLTAEIDPEEHLIKNVQIDGEDVYRAESGAASHGKYCGARYIKAVRYSGIRRKV